MKVIVKNNTVSEHGYIVIMGMNGTEKEKKAFTVHPGWNQIDADLWKLAQSKPIMQWRLEEGVYEVKGDEIADNANPLEKLKDREAVKVVEETFSDELLETWSANEKRSKVKAALRTQITKLELPDPATTAKTPIKG